MDLSHHLHIRWWEIDLLPVPQFLEACAAVQQLRDDVEEARNKK